MVRALRICLGGSVTFAIVVAVAIGVTRGSTLQDSLDATLPFVGWNASLTLLFASIAVAAASMFCIFLIDRRRILHDLYVVARRCPHCEYDLRGGPHVRCPECGRPVESAAGRER